MTRLAPRIFALATCLVFLPHTGSAQETTALPGDDELGTLCYDDGTSKPITSDGVLWFAKMVDGETWGNATEEDASSMAWAIAQRFHIWRYKDWSFRKMVQNYSQPVNPIWTKTGRRCKKYYAADYEGEIADNCSKKRVAKRAQNIKKGWDELNETARRVTVAWAKGEVANEIPGAVGWWAPGAWNRRVKNGTVAKENEVEIAQIDGNVYFGLTRNPDTSGWDGSEATVVAPGVGCPASGE